MKLLHYVKNILVFNDFNKNKEEIFLTKFYT